MGTVNVVLGEDTRLNLILGQQLENAVTEVVFDFSAWKTTYGTGTLALSVQRPGDDQPYAVALTTSGTNATWSVTNLDTAYKGVGHIQLTYTVGSAIKKSVVYKFTVYESLGANGEYPSPGQTWQQNIEAEIGTLSNLPTTDKSSLVASINEIDGDITDVKKDLNYEKTATPGYILTATNDGNGSTWSPVGLPTEEQTAQAVSDWLDDHPEATTTVQDGAITKLKINDTFLPIIINSGYVLDSFTGDLGAAVNSALAEHDIVIVPPHPSSYYSYSTKIVLNSNQKTVVIHGEAHYTGNDAAIEIIDAFYCKVFVDTLWANNGSCIRVKSQNDLCEFNEIHSMYLYGKIPIEIATAGTGAVQYCSFYSNYIRAYGSSAIGIYIHSDTASAWNGEIKFFGGEINGSSATGIYTSGYTTAIRAFGLGIENTQTAISLNGKSEECTFYGMRLERSGPVVLADIVRDIVIDGPSFFVTGLDLSGATNVSGVSIRGRILSSNGYLMGNEYSIGLDGGGLTSGISSKSAEYYYINNSNGGEIGGTLTGGCIPSVARIVSTGTFTLSASYSVNAKKQLIIYAEKAGITVKSTDATKTLFITTDAQSVWRVTPTDANNYFSPSGYLVEKITPYKQA